MINAAVVYVATYPNMIRISRAGTHRLSNFLKTKYSTYPASFLWQEMRVVILAILLIEMGKN